MFFGAGLSGSIPGLQSLVGTGFFIMIGIIALALAVLTFFVARGLWKGKKWARIVAIILAALGIINSITNLGGGTIIGVLIWNLIFLVIQLVIGGYLLFGKKVKAVFK